MCAAPGFAQLPTSAADAEKQLGVTPTQKARIKTVEAKYKPQFDALQKKYAPKIDALKRQMTALQQQASKEATPLLQKAGKEVEAIYTPAQRAKLKSWQQQQAAQRQGAGSTGMGGAMGGQQ